MLVASITYSERTYRRARQAMRCAPFRRSLYDVMVDSSVDLTELRDREGVRRGYTTRPLPELVAEDELMWLIQVGAIRREVDGQGITSRYRLAPIGRQLLGRFEPKSDIAGTAHWVATIWNQLLRWRILR
ncbi:MAG: Npun_F0494 family protein [Cyanobacteria bacterium J06597_1]